MIAERAVTKSHQPTSNTSQTNNGGAAASLARARTGSFHIR